MWTVIEANQIIIIIALLIGLVAGWWIFRSARRGDDAAAPEPRVESKSASRSARGDDPEDNGVASAAAAATADVAGEILGVDAHPDVPAAAGPPDNLQTLKGVGPKLASQLNGFGITRFDQLAALSGADLAALDDRLGAFKGRLARDRVAEQASYLAKGDRAGFEQNFGKLGGGA